MTQNLIHSMSQHRQSYLDRISYSDRQLVIELEHLIGKYCFVPLDIPNIIDTNIVDWFQENKKSIIKLNPSVGIPQYGDGHGGFDSVDVYKDETYYPVNKTWEINPYNFENFKFKFKDIYEQVLEYMPFKDLNGFMFWSSTQRIIPHRDHNIFVDFPNNFRTMIYDNNPEQTLWVKEHIPETQIKIDGTETYVPRLKESNSYIWNNLRVLHGSNYSPDYFKIMMVYTRFQVDWYAYRELMERSISKYSDLLLASNNSVSKFLGHEI